MNILSVEKVSKSYSEKKLFEEITFGIDDQDKIGVIGINGTGKSTLLKVIAQMEDLDDGRIIMKNNITISYLSQIPDYDHKLTIFEEVTKNLEKDISDEDRALKQSQAKTLLTKLGTFDFDLKMSSLSEGQRKRVVLARVLMTPCDLLILDEPTNHMDSGVIGWLEKYLKERKGALLMITHDRYFLDRVVNKTLEISNGNIYTYSGGYSEYVKSKVERQEIESQQENKKKQLYKKELEWIRAGVKARATKQKARIQRFENIEGSMNNGSGDEMELEVAYTRLGGKIIELKNVSKTYDNVKNVIDDFSFVVSKNDRIGIVGKNGAGKSTLLNIICSKLKQTSGEVSIGTTVKIGYFSQNAEDMDRELRAIEYIKNFAELVTTPKGNTITAAQMMEKFMFDKSLQWQYISKLSGGELKRLYLLGVLIESPNILILDEPTNDLDIDTLKILEDYIDNFLGVVITVSHDRYFLDRVCDKILAIDSSGKIEENTGNYTDYLEKNGEGYLDARLDKGSKTTNDIKEKNKNRVKTKKLKMTYKEEQEYKTLDDDVEKLMERIEKIEGEMSSIKSDFAMLTTLSQEKDDLEEELLLKLERGEYFEELIKQIEEQ